MKPVEEVIDVVGDFGPGKPDETSFQVDDNFDMSFDITGIQNDSQQMQMQDQSLMLPPHIGKFEVKLFRKRFAYEFLAQVKMTTTVSKQLKQ